MYAAELRPRAKPGYVHSLSCDPVKFSQDLGRANLTLASTQNRRLLASKPTSELPETTLRFTHIYMEVSNRLLRNMVRYLRDSAFVVHYIEFVLMAALRN